MARSSKLESGFQDRIIAKIKDMLPGCMVFKMDQFQGVPDLLVLVGETWFSLELKRSATASRRPNQDYFVDLMNSMSFSRFVYPENEEDVLDEIYETFRS